VWLLVLLVSVSLATPHADSLPQRPEPPQKSPRFTKLRTLVYGSQLGPGCDVQDPSPMIRDPVTNLWHFWSVFGCNGKCGWAGSLRHWYSNTTDLETAAFVDGGMALSHATDPSAPDSNGQFSPAIFYDSVDTAWYLFYSATGKNGSATRQCITEPTGCESSEMVASSASPHGPWIKLGCVARAKNDGSWNARLVDSGRALEINGKRGYYSVGFRGAAHVKAGAPPECVEGVYFPEDPASFRPPCEWVVSNLMYSVHVHCPAVLGAWDSSVVVVGL
jgi:hypothetical protein